MCGLNNRKHTWFLDVPATEKTSEPFEYKTMNVLHDLAVIL